MRWLVGVLGLVSACLPTALPREAALPVPVDAVPADPPAPPSARTEDGLDEVQRLVASGDDVAAVAWLRQRVTSAPRHVDPWLMLAQIYAAHGADDAALRVLDAATCAVEPQRRWEVSHVRGLLLFQLELPDEALEALEVVKQLQPYRRSGIALGEALSRDLYFGAAAWIAAFAGKTADADKWSKAYLDITCQSRDGADCEVMRQLRACAGDARCSLGRMPAETLSGDPDTSIHGCDGAALPTLSIHNLERTAGLTPLPAVLREFRLQFLQGRAAAAEPATVEATVHQRIRVSGGSPSSPEYLVTVLALTVEQSPHFALPTMNPTIDAKLERLRERETWRFLRGQVRIGQRYPTGMFVSPRHGVFVPEHIVPVAP